MKQSTFIVKKKFFTLVLFLLAAFVLTIASCTYNGDADGKGQSPSGANPGASGEEHGEPPPIKTLEQLLDEAYNGVIDAAKLTKAKLPYINPETQSSEEIEKHLRPLGLARMEDTPDSKMMLFYKVWHYSDPGLKKGHKKTYLWTRELIMEGMEYLRYESSNVKDNDMVDGWNSPDIPGLPKFHGSGAYEFTSIRDFLEFRWNNFNLPYTDPRSSIFFTKISAPWTNLRTGGFPGLDDHVNIRGMFFVRGGHSSCSYAFKTVEYANGSIKEPEVYFANALVMVPMGIDWDITFINKDDESDMYSFVVARYEVGYNKSQYYPSGGIYPPVDDLRPGESDLKYGDCALHMLKLSTLVGLSLEKKLKEVFETDQIINLIKTKYSIDDTAAKEKINEEIKKRVDSYKREFPPFKIDFKNLKDWDIYLSFKDYAGVISTPGAIWRNTVKLNGPETVAFCKPFWED